MLRPAQAANLVGSQGLGGMHSSFIRNGSHVKDIAHSSAMESHHPPQQCDLIQGVFGQRPARSFFKERQMWSKLAQQVIRVALCLGFAHSITNPREFTPDRCSESTMLGQVLTQKALLELAQGSDWVRVPRCMIVPKFCAHNCSSPAPHFSFSSAFCTVRSISSMPSPTG